MKLRTLLALVSTLFSVMAFAAGQDIDVTRRKLATIAQRVSHFATRDIIANRWSDSRWPPKLLAGQQQLLADLRALSAERAALAAFLASPDPKVRTLALGALFVREDPQDLPLIAPLVRDSEATFPLLHESLNSMGGELPLVEFESSQTVGDVAREMLWFYLEAASVSDRSADERTVFTQYWAERGTRARCASWFLAKMKRATRQTSPLQPEYRKDIQRVLAEIKSLPPTERAWTLFYVRQGVFLTDPEELLSDAKLITELKSLGPAALMKFLQHQPGIDDPDLKFTDSYDDRRNLQFLSLAPFILQHAADLLRPEDADAVLAGGDGELPTRQGGHLLWVAAAVELRGLQDPVKAADSLKREIERIPLRGYEGQTEQAGLATALWRMRGAAEKNWLTNWFYTALPLAQDNLAHGPADFLRAVQEQARPDTPALLAAIVGDARFANTDWASLVEILKQVNDTLDSPLVEKLKIYDYQPRSKRPDQKETLAGWRNLLRRHFARR